VSPPSAKLVQLVRGTFVNSLYKAFSGMVENAERGVKEDDAGTDEGGVVASDPERSGEVVGEEMNQVSPHPLPLPQHFTHPY